MKKILLCCGFFFLSCAYASVSNGPYVGVEAGVANQILNYNVASFNLNTNGVNLTNAAAVPLIRGNFGYNINKISGFELGASYNFNSSHTSPIGSNSFNMNATTLDASYILSLPTVFEKVSVFGRIGFAYDWINSADSCGCVISNGMSGSGFADVLGAGIKYRLSTALSWRLEWIANGLLFPVGINAGSMQANWTNQTFQTGLNYSF
jgi:opacity protein-like surface antigen